MLRRIPQSRVKTVSDGRNSAYKGPGVGRRVARVEKARAREQETRSERDWAHGITEGITLGSLTWELGTRVLVLNDEDDPRPFTTQFPKV